MFGETLRPLCLMEGKINKYRYTQDVLEDTYLPWLREAEDDLPLTHGLDLMEDGAKPHQAYHTRNWKEAHRVNTISWPAVSPDLNPIEHLWDVLEHRIRPKIVAMNIKKPQPLIPLLKEEWEKLRGEPEILKKLVHSMPHRVN